MATKRIKDLTNTAASVASDAYLAIDGTSNGTEKITRDNFRQDTADAFVAAPGTYNLAPLSGGAVEVAKGGTGSTTAAGARTNLSVNSIDEDAQANGTKVTAPALYFNGTSSVVTVADDDKFSFTNGVDDLPFSVSAFVKADDFDTNFQFIGKYGASPLEYSAYITTGAKIGFLTYGGAQTSSISTATITSGEWVHVCITYPGAGPNSNNGFAANQNGTKIYINGIADTVTPSNNGSYTGMANTAATLTIGKQGGSTYGKGHIRGVKIFNRSLTASEVAELARGNDLGFADEWGGALGGVYTSTFVGTTNGWTAVNGTVNHSTSVGGESDALRLTLDGTTGGHYLQKTGVFTRGKRYRVKGRYYVPTNSHVDGIYFVIGTSGVVEVVRAAAPTLDSWIDFSVEVVANATADTDRLLVYALDGNSTTITDPGADDVIYILDLVVTEIGTLADFRSERYDTSTSKLYDLSDNAFVGTGTSVTLTGREVPVYETGTWTPSLYFSGTSAATYSVQDGYYSRIGDTVYIRGSITLSGIGASSGAVSVAGLPFQPSGNGASSSVMPVHMTSALNLTSSPTGLVGDGVSQIQLYDAGATGQTALDETNFGASTVLKIAGTYKIQ